MKDYEYEVVLNYIRRAQDALVVVIDELVEFGDKHDQRLADEARELINKVNRLGLKVAYHRRVVAFAAQGDALRAP